ncbi:MAG TPA: choice-of-anchor D domain-containing protein [Actinomycetota bacterium]
MLLLGMLAPSAVAAEEPTDSLVKEARKAIAEMESGHTDPLSVLNTTSDPILEGFEARNARMFEQLDLVQNHLDPTGLLRNDLWLKGIQQTMEMPVSADMIGAPGSGVQGAQWTQVGPGPIRVDADQIFMGTGPNAGEVLDLAIDPRNTTDRIIYVATNDGGIWKSTDGGASWEAKTDFLPSLSMGAVSLDPSNPSIVYAGSGNNFDGSGGAGSSTGFSRAAGLYRSVDMGETWTVLDPGAIFSGPQLGINRIVLPAPGVLLLATNGGVFRSVDGGTNFGDNAPMFDDGDPIINGNITDIDLDVTDPTRVYASRTGTGILVSTDSGATFPLAGNLFTALNGGPTSGLAYIALAQGVSDDQRMYATVGNPWNGLYRSDDGGANWAKQDNGVVAPIGADDAAADNGGCQCGYDQTVGVDPQDADRVYIAFQELYLSTDGGATFGIPAISRNLIHWDHHAITFSPSTHWSGGAPTDMYVGTDGGLHRTLDGGTTWTSLNEGVATVLFKQIDMGRGSATNRAVTMGGTQDNGTLHDRTGYAGTDWHQGQNGDGGPVAIDPTDATNAYSHRNGTMKVTTDGGDTWSNTTAQPTGGAWRIAIDPNDVDTVWVGEATGIGFNGNGDLWRSTDATATMTELVTFTGNIRAIATSKLDSNVLWVGLSNGRVARSINATAATPTWSEFQLPGTTGRVNGVAIDPTNTDMAVAVVGGFSNVAPPNRTEHVYLTTNGGTSWTDISGTDGQAMTNLPDLPTHSVVIDAGTSPHSIIVSNDGNVFRSTDLGATWFRLGLGLPVVDARTLVMDDTAEPPILRVGTYGRSTFELTGADGPLMAINGDLAFGNVAVGTSKEKVIQIFNVGSADLHVNAFFRSSGSPEFQVSSGPATPVTIPPGGHADFTVRFTPVSPGNKTAEFQVNSDDPFEPTKTIPASGTGVTGESSISTLSLNFGGVPVDDRTEPHSSDLIVTVYNQASCDDCDMRVTDADITGTNAADFTLVGPPSLPQTIGAGNHLDFTVRFNPSDEGNRVAVLEIDTDDPSNPNYFVGLDGAGIVPSIEAAPDTIIFPPTVVDPVCVGPCGESLPTTISNPGQAELIVDRYDFATTAYPAAYSDTGGSLVGQRLAPNTNIDRSILFHPAGGPQRAVRGTLTIVDDGSPGPGDVPAKTVSFCGEATGRGIRVLVVDRFGTPISTVKELKLTTVGVDPAKNITAKSLAPTTVSPPTSCEAFTYHYENQNLPATMAGDPHGSYYKLDATVNLAGQELHAKAEFTLASNEFKTIVLTAPKPSVPMPACSGTPNSVPFGAAVPVKLDGSGWGFSTMVDATIDGDVGLPVGSFMTDAAGKFNDAPGTIPSTLTQGSHVVFFRALDQNGDSATCAKVFTVKAPSGAPSNATCAIKPGEGTVGASTSVLLGGQGWAPGNTVTVERDSTEAVASATTGADGKFANTPGVVPVSYEQGKHVVIYSGLLSDGLTMGSCAKEFKNSPT